MCETGFLRRLSVLWLLAGALSLASCASDDVGSESGPVVINVSVLDEPEPLVGASSVEVYIFVDGLAGYEVPPGLRVELSTRGGGGFVDPPSVMTNATGEAFATWTFGVAPVYNYLRASVDGQYGQLGMAIRVAAPLEPAQFGDIPGLIAKEGLPGSTEDLAFDGDRRLLLGIGGGLIEMDPDGNAVPVQLSGDPIEAPLGIAFDADGNLWVADSRDGAAMPEPGALLRVSPDGVVSTALTAVDGEDLAGPNYVAIGGDGKVYLSDPCIGAVLRFDPVLGAVDAEVRFDLATQGGPNGLAFDANGRLFLATENVALLCGRPDVDPTLVNPVAGLFSLVVDESGFGPIEPVAEGMGLFGDGLAFDAEGNLYVIFDTQANFALEESAVWVLPASPNELITTQLLKFFAASDRVFANIAFGRGAFGDTTMYLSLLAIDAFDLPIRGVERIDIGIPGAPLPY